jgi:hypothetical protein
MKYVLKIISVILFLLSFIFIKIALHVEKDILDGSSKLLFWALSLFFSGCGFFFFKKSKHLSQKKGKEILKLDPRNPILYLRSFLHDPLAAHSENDSAAAKFLSFGIPQNLNSEEEQIAFAVNDFGPMIAIGDPKESIPQLGASRIYTENENWKDVVIDLVKLSQLVILRVGDTPGFWWEVEMVLKNKKPLELIFLLPSSIKLYNQFKERFESIAPYTLPSDYDPFPMRNQSFSAVLTFNSKWMPSFIYSKENANWILNNGNSVDFKLILSHIMIKAKLDYVSQFETSRMKPQEPTFLAKGQLLGGIIFLGLIAAAVLTAIVEAIAGIEPIRAFSPPMLISWTICSFVINYLVKFGKK